MSKMPHWKSHVAAHVYNNTISVAGVSLICSGNLIIIGTSYAVMILMSTFQHACTGLPCWARGIIVVLCIQLLPFFLYVSSEGSDETARLRQLVRYFAA